MMTVSGLHSQSLDTTGKVWIPRPDALATLSKAQEATLLSQKVSILNTEIAILNYRIFLKEETIKDLEQKDANNDSLIVNYKKEIAIMKDQRKIYEGEVGFLNKEIKRYKRKLFWRTAAGVVVLGGLTFLYITK